METPSFLSVALSILGIDFLRYLLGAGLVWLVINVLLHRRLANRRILGGAPRPGLDGARSGASPATWPPARSRTASARSWATSATTG